MRLKNLLLTTLVMLSTAAFAQLESGKVYRFINKADTNIAMTAASTTDVYGSKKMDNGYAQLWLAEQHPNNAGAWSLRSVGNGLYLTPRGTSTGWTFSVQPSSSTVLYCINTTGSYYTLNSVNNAGNGNCMHYATSQGGRIVGWNTGADATHWTIEEVSVSDAELETNWEELNTFNSALTAENLAKFEVALANLFSDKACTKLAKNFASVDALKADADYKVLPTALQEMVVKVYTDNWQEDNFDSSKPYWDSEHAKRFRIQSIEPYSVAGEITEWLGLNAHINMDNPLGITGNYRQHVFIIVEGEVKEGAELYVGSLQGHGLLNTYENGVELKEGLNVVPFHGNGNTLYINYVVHTYQNGKFVNPLSGYKDLKVHIAGGNVNGYYNGVGDCLWGEPDDDDDWQYYEDRTNTESATILGKRQILHFTMWPTQVTDEDGTVRVENNCMAHFLPNNINVPAGTPAKQNVNTMLEAWDRIHLSELATMGLLSKAEMDSLNNLYSRPNEKWEAAGPIYEYGAAMYENQDNVDYSEHFNHHGIALGNFSGYMSGGWRNCNYNQSTMGDIIGNIATNAGAAWGPAHEIGHQHQKVFTVNGLTEVTNNMHSNIAIWYMGIGTSRVNGDEGSLNKVYDNYVQGNHFLFHRQAWGSQNLWSQTQMYYKLWMYFHLVGHNTNFFPRLFELNRRDRMSSGGSGANNLGWIDGIPHASGTSSMLKYYKQACVAAGEDLTEFFRAYGFFVLMNQELRGDYGNSYYTQTQEEVDAAIAWVKSLGLKENLSPIFINDCVATPSYSHDGKTLRSYWDPNETGSGKNAAIGMYTDFINPDVKAEGYYYKRTTERTNDGQTNFKLEILRKDGAKGAVGFIVYKDGELVAFTNHYTLNLPKTIGSSAVDVYVVQADGTKELLLTAAEAGSEAEQLQYLTASINKAKAALALLVKDGSETGYYFAKDLEKLQELYNAAKAAYDNKDQSQNSYGKWSMLLDAEYDAVTAAAYMNIKEKAVYRITNAKKSKYALTNVNGTIKATTDDEVAADDNSKLWYIESTGVDGEYYIKDKNGNYISYVEPGMASKVGGTTKKVFYAEHKATGTFKFVTDGSTAEAGLYLDESKYNVNGEFNTNILSNDNLGYWRLVVVEGLEESRAYEVEILNTLIARADGILERAISNTNDEVVVNHDIVAPTDTTMGAAASLKSFFTTILDARNNAIEASEDKSILDYLPYIADLRAAFAGTDSNYYFTTPATPDTNEETVYYIKDLNIDGETSLYCGADEEGKIAHTAIVNRENNKNFWWTFVPTEKGYMIKNLGTGNYLYRNTRGIWANSTTKGDEFDVKTGTELPGLLLCVGSRYITVDNGYLDSNNSLEKAVHFVIEKLMFDNTTGIEEVIGESNDAAAEGIFDLMGRRVENPAKGIYIVNGKKVLVK